jgi:hypothetical protein
MFEVAEGDVEQVSMPVLRLNSIAGANGFRNKLPPTKQQQVWFAIRFAAEADR